MALSGGLSAALQFTISGARRLRGQGVASRCRVNCVAAILLSAATIALSAQEGKTPGQTPPAQAPGVVATVKIEPDHATLAPGEIRQFTGTVSGTGTFSPALTWLVNDVAGGNASLGTVSSSGLYVTPYPTPATVTIKATSKADLAKSASATIAFAAPPVAEGPALLVDAAAPAHPISPLIYGMNAYRLSDPWHEAPRVAKAVRLPLNRWGGDADTRYNYNLDVSNSGEDWFFEIVPKSNIPNVLIPALFTLAIILYGLAWWTVWKKKPSGRSWGIVASLLYIAVSLLGIKFAAQPLLGYEGIILALGVTGLVAFVDGSAKKQASGSVLEGRPRRMDTLRRCLCWVFAITSLISLGLDFRRIALSGGDV